MRDLNIMVSGDVNIILPGEAGPVCAADADPARDETVRQLEQTLAGHRKSQSTPDNRDENESDDAHEKLEQSGILFDHCDIVAVIHPECGVSAMMVEESRSVLDVFGGDELGCTFPLLDLQMAFKSDGVAAVGGRKYLIGTAVVFAANGNHTVSLDGEDIHLVKRILEESCKTICCQGQMARALPL